jgi:AcrR family transcriptional regulator
VTPAERKQADRQRREELILDTAHRLLLRDGFQNFNLDELAREIAYAKGTIYLHFETKEDLALTVVTRALKERADLFERASKFQGKSRERIRAFGFACCQFACAHPDYFKAEMTLKSASFWEKATESRRQAHMVQGARCFRLVHEVVKEAVRLGDLPQGPVSTEGLAFSLIAVTVGSHIMAQEPALQLLAGIENPIASVRQNQDLMCDGMGWKPLLKDWDYAATDVRIRNEIFPEATWINLNLQTA